MKKFQIMSFLARKRQKKQGGKKGTSLLKRIMLGILFLGFSSVILVSVFLLTIIRDLPNLSNINEIIFSESSIIYDRHGEELYTLHGDENRQSVDIEEMPDNLIFATISIEDSDFFEHHGFSIKGLTKAVLSEIISFGSHRSGGSTLTQQFVKNTFLNAEKTYTRKIKELILSLQIEWKFSKDEILEMYLNSIPYGSNSHGVEQASLTFFGKSVHELSLEESTILAALPQAPTYYSPYGSHVHTGINLPEEEVISIKADSYEEFLGAIGEESLTWGLLPTKIFLENKNEILIPGRTTLVLDRMEELGFITGHESEIAKDNLSQFTFQRYRTEIKAPHFVMYVRDLLEEQYGKEFLNAGGLQIYTTLDWDLQQKAEEIVALQAEKNEQLYGAKNAAVVSAVPSTGEILTMVGSRDYWDEENDGNVNLHLQRRLPGSSFKPFAYAAAFSAGYAPATIAFDVETDFGNDYKPQNYDGEFRGPVSFRKALGNSLNIPAVKAGVLGGLKRTYSLAKGMGVNFLKDADWYGGALPLGVAEIRPIDMLQAYSTFANMGKRVEIQPFLKILDKHGNILFALEEQKGEQVLDTETAYLVTDVLSDPNARGAGWNSMLQLPGRINAVKTGTSNKKKNDKVMPLDGWTIGYTPELVTVAWAGNNNGSVMNSRGSGFSVAGPIWRNVMIEALKDTSPSQFQKPSGIKAALVTTLTGKLPTVSFPKDLVVKEIFSPLNLPKEYDDSLGFIIVDKITKELPNEFTPEDAKEKVAVVKWTSLRSYDPEWEDPVQAWVEKNAEGFFEKLGVDEVLAKAPETVESVHTRTNTLSKPKITITSPIAFGSVSPTGVGVWTDIESQYGIALVEFFLDGELVDSVITSPYKGNIRFPEGTKEGDVFTITAKVYDTLYNANSSTVDVRVANDTQAPVTEIIYPYNNGSYSGSSVITVQTNSYDVRSDIKKVEFYFDEEIFAEIDKAPYIAQLTLPNLPGSHSLKVVAFDNASNTAEDEITLSVTPKKIGRSLSVETPEEMIFGDSVELTFFVPVEDVANIESVELVSRYKSKEGVDPEDDILVMLDNLASSNGIFYYRWIRPLVGEYDVFVKAKYKNGKVLFSSKNRVTVK